MSAEITKFEGDVTTLNVVGILNDVKSDLAGDVTLVEGILADVGIGLDLSQLLGTVDSTISLVETLYTQVEAIEAGVSVAGTVGEVETLINTWLADLRKLE